MQDFTIIIPARYASSRLPAKPLLDIMGKPMVIHVVERALQTNAKQVIVATDSKLIMQIVNDYGYQVCLTSEHHNSGTERLAEVITKLKIPTDEIIVNVQGDEPLIPPVIIQQVANNLATHTEVKIATLSTPLTAANELFNPNIVKVITDRKQHALYFSRAPIPWDRNHFNQVKQAELPQLKNLNAIYARHIGIYAYRAGFIQQYLNLPVSPIETIEMLEQLRILWHAEKIHVDTALAVPAIGVDTQDDLIKVQQIMQQNKP